jgi:hypothetical protein
MHGVILEDEEMYNTGPRALGLSSQLELKRRASEHVARGDELLPVAGAA